MSGKSMHPVPRVNTLYYYSGEEEEFARRNALRKKANDNAYRTYRNKRVTAAALGYNSPYEEFDNLPFFQAIQHGNKDKVEVMIDENPSLVNVLDETRTGNTPLFAATKYGHKDIVELLLSKGANVNAQNIEEVAYTRLKAMAALHKAALNKNKDIVELLLTSGADVNLGAQAAPHVAFTPLMMAVGVDDNMEIINMLLARGATVTRKLIKMANRAYKPMLSAALPTAGGARKRRMRASRKKQRASRKRTRRA